MDCISARTKSARFSVSFFTFLIWHSAVTLLCHSSYTHQNMRYSVRSSFRSHLPSNEWCTQLLRIRCCNGFTSSPCDFVYEYSESERGRETLRQWENGAVREEWMWKRKNRLNSCMCVCVCMSGYFISQRPTSSRRYHLIRRESACVYTGSDTFFCVSSSSTYRRFSII